MFIRFCKQASNRELKKRYFSSSNNQESEAPRRNDIELTTTSSSIEQSTTTSSSHDDDNEETILKENGSTAQTVDLVADCPESIVATSSRSISPTNAGEATSSTNPAAASPSMGQRPSSVGLLRPKISLTWVLRGQQFHSHNHHHHQNCIYQQQQANNNNNNNNNSNLLNNQHSVVVELHREKDANPAKEREDKERAFRRSVKSAKSVKSVKSVKSAKSTARNPAGSNKNNLDTSSRNKDRNKENLDKPDRKTIPLHTYDKIERADAVTEKNQLNEAVAAPLQSSEKRLLEKDHQVIKEATAAAKEIDKDKVKRAISEPNLIAQETSNNNNNATREKPAHRHRKPKRAHRPKTPSTFGYEIADLDSFLTKASIEQPANIPVVLSQATTLYQTQNGTQAELALPLGTVVNAVFKNQAWLYVQTPHGHEGYVGYAACLALGILPQSTRGPCWEDSTDVFPRPLGNLTDTEKLRDTRSECGGTTRRTTTSHNNNNNNNEIRRTRRAQSVIPRSTSNDQQQQQQQQQQQRESRSVRHTLLLVREDYEDKESSETLNVSKGDVVVLLAERAPDWFWVRARDGRQGFIPAAVAGHGFL